MSVLYRPDSSLLSSALLSSLLWSELAGVRKVVVQVYNNTPLLSQDDNIVDTMIKNDIEVRFGQQTDGEGNSLCDQQLRERLSRFLLYSQYQVEEDDIILVSDSNVFLSRPHYINVLQSGHQAWMFLSELIFYLNRPWNQIMALTVNTWRSSNYKDRLD